MKHTPGPWKVGITGQAAFTPGVPGPWEYLINPTGIGTMFTTKEEAEANACVIAAAPELLEVLERLLAYQGYTESTVPEQVLCRVCWEQKPRHTSGCMVARAEAAIRKAKGE